MLLRSRDVYKVVKIPSSIGKLFCCCGPQKWKFEGGYMGVYRWLVGSCVTDYIFTVSDILQSNIWHSHN